MPSLKTIYTRFYLLTIPLLALLLFPINTYAEAIGSQQINNLYNSVYDTLKLVGPLAATIYIGINAIQVYTDPDNPNKKSRLINSVLISAFSLLLLFGAPVIVNQLKSISGG